jgi:hypothetical protein
VSISQWPARRLLLLGIGWAILAFAWFIWRGLTMLPDPPGGVAAVSFGLWPLAYVALGPPLVLVLVWLVVRRLSKE